MEHSQFQRRQQNALGANRKTSMTERIPAEKKVVICVFQFSVKPEILKPIERLRGISKTHEVGPYK
jgi:hypothetical protein